MSKKGAIWVSVVLYIMISFAVLSLVLVSVQPIIDKNRDKAICEQTEIILKNIDSRLSEVSETQGTRLSSNVRISRGSLIINSLDNRIVWNLKDSAYQFSEDGKEIIQGKIHILTKKNNNKWNVTMYLDYQDVYDIKFNSQEIARILTESGQDYTLGFENIDSQNRIIDVSMT